MKIERIVLVYIFLCFGCSHKVPEQAFVDGARAYLPYRGELLVFEHVDGELRHGRPRRGELREALATQERRAYPESNLGVERVRDGDTMSLRIYDLNLGLVRSIVDLGATYLGVDEILWITLDGELFRLDAMSGRQTLIDGVPGSIVALYGGTGRVLVHSEAALWVYLDDRIRRIDIAAVDALPLWEHESILFSRDDGVYVLNIETMSVTPVVM